MQGLRRRDAVVEHVADSYGPRNTIRVQSREGKASRLYVKTRCAGDWQTDMRKGTPRTEDPDEGHFWLFVDLVPARPEFYVAPAWWVENDIYENHKAYLARHGGQRARNPHATHHRLTTNRVQEWRDRWDVLGLEGRRR
jgi:hypothetical protein